MSSERNGLEIAIIGMAGRFPQARDLERFWQNLRDGVEAISFFTDEELAAEGISSELLADPGYVKAAGVLTDVELFDAAFFDVLPREAELIDPQQRLLLECAFEALERAGYASTSRSVGVFAGTNRNSYLVHNIASNPEVLASVGGLAVALASEHDFIATRLSYKLNLSGPSLTVQTACSTSLVAVHLACQSLLGGECDIALAGAASVRSPQKGGHLYQPGGISSPDGHCRAFDARAQGTVLGQGVGVVVLKPLEEALADGDHIHAVIKGSAINNDGGLKAGFTAPNRDGQAQVIWAAHRRADVEPDSISYIEGHGTATPLGDPIEVAALIRAFRHSTERRQFCALGSVKTNIGHLDAAAGIAGLIKTTLALEHRQIPPSLHFEEPNPEIDLAASPFSVNTRLTEWKVEEGPRRAGVSAFGLGGTNAHIVLEEAPPVPPSGPSRPWQILALSARSAEALEQATDRLADHLEAHPEQSLADVAFTLHIGRRELAHRRVLLATDAADAAGALAARDPRRVWTSETEEGDRPVAFLLPGLGDHYPGMAQELYRTEEVFRREIDRSAERLRPELGLDLREALRAGAAAPGGHGLDLRAMLGRGGDRPASGETLLHQTWIAQPAVFAVSWALAQLWMSWGVRPRALLGYSLGEYTAACLAGVLPIDDALLLVARRARLISELPPGAMLAVPLPEEEAARWLSADLSLAAVNGPGVSVLSGAVEAVAEVEKRLAQEGVPSRRLPTTHAFHSAMMEPLRGPLAGLINGLRLAPPRIPYLSNVTGTWITAEEATDPAYWARHLCEPVRFGPAVEALWSGPERALLEVGPGQGLSTLALQHPASRGVAVPSLPHSQDRQPEGMFLSGAAARLWLAGVAVDWTGFYAGQERRRLPLPTYPFERRRFWIDPRPSGVVAVPRVSLPAEAGPQPPAPTPATRRKVRTPYVAPGNRTEERLVALWQSLLGIEPIGVHDNFFELGGHSLLGTQVLARLRAADGVELPLAALFENPTVADLAREMAKVSVSVRPPLTPRSEGLAELPLSYAQQRLWFLDQISSGSPLHNIASAFSLRGPLDREILTRAFSEIVRRHGTLRTTFAAVDGVPVQRVAPEGSLEIPFEDLSGLPALTRETAVRGRLREESRRPFDLSRGPLLRVVLLRLGPEEHALLLVFHHIVSDGWSIQLTLSELIAIYTARAAGKPSPLPPLAIQYTDYAIWQREWLDGGALAEQLAFWTEHLAGAPLVLDLPTDRPHPAAQTFDGAAERIALPAELSAALSGFAIAERATLFMVLLGAFKLLLHRHGAQDDIVIGTPIANRTEPETERLIGLFVNTLALRTDLSGDPTFRGLLARVSRGTLAAYDRQDLPFDRLVEALQPERTLARTPVVQVLFQLLNQPVEPGDASGFTIEALDPEAGIASFDLTFSLAEARGGLVGLFEYNTDLFDAATVEALLSRFSILLEGIAADPDRRLSELPLLSAPELRQVLHAGNDTAAEIPRAPVHRLFEAQAEKTPEAVAAVFGGERLTYAGLNARANRLARRLRSLGVGPEELVGVSLERSLDLLVAVLGILKAGAAYLPLDPSYPAERLAFMRQDSGAVLVLDAPEDPEPGAGNPGNPEGDTGPQSLAYVLYTSGSTGRPKGVQVPHGALANFLASMGREPGLEPGDVLLAVTSLSFDIAALELYLPLLTGARVEIASREAAGDGRLLLELLRSSGATVVQATPATWRMLLDAGWEETDCLRLAMTGGEALRADLAARLLPRADEVWNVYGPTETTVWSTAHRVEADSAPTVPIGRPIANTRLYGLDRLLVPRPPGAPGELYIGGAGVARGYHGRPDLTAERFVPDPWSAAGGERLYRTGDLVRALPDGAFEFLGRVDHQVKVRGFRIETGEIEAALAAHPAVREAAVVVRTDGGEPRLVAYVVRHPGAAGSDAELREFLGRSLPDYMVPGVFMALDALPLTPNRKVDRKALPAPERAAAAAFVAPRNPVEETLAAIWADVLRLPRVGVADDFFSLGGHSLLATRMISRVQAAFGVEVSVRSLFEAPTIAGLAGRIGAGQGAAAPPPLLRAERGAEIPLSFAQERLWFLAQLEADSSAYHLPAVLRLHGALDHKALQASLSEIVRRHEPLRTVFTAVDGRPLQVVREPAPLPLPLVDLAALPAEHAEPEMRRLAGEEIRRSFDLARGPLARATLLRLGGEDHAFLWNTHHIVSDGWSIGLFVYELGVLYSALAAGRPSPLPELPIAYADYAVWQRRWLQGEILSDQLTAWKRHFEGAPETLDLPADRPRPAVQTFRGGRRSSWLRPGSTAALRELGSHRGATLYMTLAAAFAALLGRSSRQEDVVLGSPTANRSRPELEGLIGLFTNTLALRIRLEGDPTFLELLDRARETALSAFSFQDVPFEKLIEELQPERSLSHTPLFQVMLILQNAPRPDLELPGLTLSPVELDTGAAMFDLTLSAVEEEERLLFQMEHNRDLFDPSTIQRFLRRLEILLEAVTAHPAARLSELPLLTAEESHQVTLAWNDTASALPEELCVHELFVQQARRSPGAVAVACGSRQLTYAELERRTRALAHRLRELGAGPEVRVGFAAERSPALVVGALAILRAGSAYVPLDPDYPHDRLAIMLEDSGASLLLTESELLGKLPQSGARVALLDDEETGDESAPLPVLDPGSLAYVLYTSGSTGRPKGVQIPHRALANFLDSMRREPGLDADDRLLAVTSLSFDIAALEIYLPLLVGARIEMARREETLDGRRLGERIAASGVTVLQATPATWSLLFNSGWPGAPLKALCGGEALPRKLADRLLASVSEAWNVYGPTETTVWSTVDRLRPAEATVPVGRPIANTTIHLLDEAFAPVPLGIPGELYIGGTGVARGYQGRPDLTAERFLPSPFGERIYRTGDLGRHRSDGRIELLGRIDHQVKVRGFRIELGEIEASLSRHPDLAQAAVVARPDKDGTARLVAYVVPAAGQAPEPAALREFLGRSLPDYMVPQVFMALDALPLTPNRKVDRKALPDPEWTAAAAFVAPRNPVEETLAAIWADVLQIPRVGVTDDFFSLGGHSLLATRMISRVQAAFGVEVSVRSLFEASTIAGLAGRIGAGQGAAAPPPLLRAERGAEIPLSFAQERLWFLAQLEADSSAYHLPAVLRLHGALDRKALQASLSEIVRRHEPLRTVFTAVDGRPVQIVRQPAPLPLPLVDLAALPAEHAEPEMRRLAGEEVRRIFDLARGPLARAALLRLGGEDHAVLWNTHHIVSDGWSIGLFVHELGVLYSELTAGRPSPLPELPIAYADYAVWQRRWLQGEILSDQLTAWKRHFEGAPETLDLPTDRPRPAVQTFRGGRRSSWLRPASTAALQELGSHGGATLYMTLTAAFAALLGRSSRQEDVVLGSPSANRSRPELEGLIGLFANTLALRVRLEGDPTFLELLDRARETALTAFSFQDVPFEKLIEELQPERSLSHTPLFQVMLILQNAPRPDLELPGLTLSPVEFDTGAAMFDLTLSAVEGEERLLFQMEHNRDLFDSSTIQRFLRRLEILLEAVTAHPAARLSELPLLTAEESHQVTLAWNDTAAALPEELCVHELFVQQARRSPGAVAVACGSRQLTYAELERRTRALAHRLRELGAGPETRVGLSVERSPDLVVAALAILRAGSAYVPLDPDYPHDRLAVMLEDSGTSLLLTESALLGKLPESGARVVLLDEEGTEGEGEPLPAVDPGSLAYVLYTSGSTGRPKGVQIPHRALANFLDSMRREPGLDADDRLLAVTSLSFDIAALEIYLPLLVGARIEMARREETLDGRRLGERIAASGVTVLQATPATWSLLFDSGWPGAPVKALCGGEALPRKLADRLLASVSEAWNVYGPTETTVWSTVDRLRPAEATVPVGRPIANTTIHLLDEAFAPVPLGIPGELCIGGTGVARGYQGRPDLTAERFLPAPFGERIYRTGDLGRHRSDGRIELLGRIDHQVKVRGFRIELGEIEAALSRHPALAQVAVVTRPDKDGTARLVAYVVPAAGQAPEPAALREFLEAGLPPYMLPAVYVTLKALPLTPNRKVDRKALPDPAPRAAAQPVAPRGPVEETLAAIWAEILDLETVGVDDNFFDLGGHSLRLVEVQARVRERLGRELSIVELFRHPTIRSLADHLEPRAARSGVVAVGAAVQPSRTGSDLAIVGMSCRFPGAPDVERFWDNLREGRETIDRLNDEGLRAAGLDPSTLDQPGYVRAEPVLEGIDLFDAAFFDFNPREAEALDPQQRLFLECAWECLEEAGYDSTRYSGRIGVFAGARWPGYAVNLFSSPQILGTLDGLTVQTSVDKDYLATRVSYKLNLRGPSLSVQTACSTSLVALHFARRAILSGDCEMALIGGVSLLVPHARGYLHQEGGILSPDGHCRAFDAKGRGTLFGSGVGLVLVKRLEDALRDGDHIHAVLKGTAVNNDGAVKVGYTAPSVEGQSEVIAAAQAEAGIPPDSIGFVEAHGTATPLGDPVEVAALTLSFRRRGAAGTGFCALGSVKTNFGHLDTAAGMAGLIKTVLALEHRQIPPTLHFEEPNPQIDFAASPFYVNTRLADWPDRGAPRRAGVSSFGIGGTNAHAVLEEAPVAGPPHPARRSHQLLVLSARSEAALEAATDRLARWLGENPEASLADVAYTLQTGRRAFEHRRVVVCDGTGDAAAALETRAPERVLTRVQEPVSRPVVFLFPGQGAQSVDMGRDIYDTEPVFRAEVDACADLLLAPLGRDLREILYPSPERREEAERELRETRFAQPALFVVEYALAQLWRSWGVEPWAMIGHSLGEYVAACLAGVFSLGDALRLVAARGELMGRMPAGAMLSTGLSEEELAPLLTEEGLSLAAVNGPDWTVASGPEDAVARLEDRLPEDVRRRRLHTSHAFHSDMMEPALAPFAERVGRVSRKPPTLPYLSNLTGEWITAGEATDPGYWARHLRRTVRFADGLERLLGAPGGENATLLEVGPGTTLATLARQRVPPAERSRVVASLGNPREPKDGAASLLQALGRLWLAGAEIDWSGVHAGERRRRLALPTYPFQRRRFWIDLRPLLPVPAAEAATVLTDAPAPGETPVAGHERPDLATAYIPPRTATEERLAEIWQRLLGIERVGIHDDFFELGGHSLLATQVLSRVREELRTEISLDTFFAAGTVAGLARAIEDSPRTGEGLEAPPLGPRPRDGAVPLSFAQQRLWFLDQLAPGSNAYNMAAPLRLTGRIHPAALSRALDEIVRRHETLRTTFQAVDGEPFQEVAPSTAQALPLVDLIALPSGVREDELRKAVLGAAGLPFDLEHGPLLRTALVRTGVDEHALLLTIHHIVSDGWSMGIFIAELAALYAAFSSGRPSPLPELPIQYADFALWQREWLQGEALERQLSFWRTLMAAAPTALELPTDRPRPSVQTFNGAIRRLGLSREVSAAVRTMAQALGATPFMVLLAAFKTLLGRSTGQTDIVAGTPVANRNRAEVEGLIGFFANTLLTRTDLSGDPPFEELVRRVQAVALGAFVHQDLPFERLVEELRPQRDVSRQPLFQVMFALQNVPVSEVEAPGLTLSPIELGEPAEHFDLTLFVHEADGVFLPALRYNTDLFDSSTAVRLLTRFELLVESAVADPGRRLSGLSSISEAESHHLLYGGNDSGPAGSRGLLVHEMFRDQARRTPDATALWGEGERLTYRELDELSDRRARSLCALGIGPETLVGICLPRVPEVVVTILAVLKAGGAYLPLDPAYPRERLAFMLNRGEVRVLLSCRELLADLPEHGATAICLDTDVLPEGREPGPPASSDQTAYVIFTSGSTGRPKGAVLTHASLGPYVAALGARLGIGEEDVYLHTASFSFSSSVRQMMLPLCRGAALVLAGPEQIRDPLRLFELIRRCRVTVADLVPSYWRSCLHALEELDDARRRELLDNDLRLLVSASERLLSDVPDGWRRLGHGARLVNMLGQTETTGIISVYPIPPRGAESIRTVPVGRPIPGTALYLLDAAMQPVPLGIPGELYIGGTGVGRGYLGQPDLTAERFVPDPWSDEPGARLYHTGDLARALPDGNLDFIGRRDQQIKIRGFRIETGEIEAALNRHPAVREAAVVARDADPATGEKLLVAYFVPADEPAPSAADLRGLLQGILPEYMVPSVFVQLASLPLTPTGKVDRSALPDVDPARSRQTTERVPPRTEKERTLAGIWAQVLRSEEIGVEDDFFELGGHSLLAAQVVSRIRKSFETEVPVRLLFEKPTIAALAQALADTPPAPGPIRTVRKVARTSQARPGSTHQLSDAEVENLLLAALEKKRKTS